MTSNSSQPRVLIVTATTWLGLARLPAALARAGAEVSVFGNPNAPALHSRHVAHRYPHRWSPEITPFLDALRNHLAAHEYHWVILGDDLVVVAARQAAHEPWLRPHYPIDLDRCSADVLASKIGFARIMDECSLPVPAWREANSPAEALAAAREIGWPVIVKPDFGLAGGGVTRADSESDWPTVITNSFSATNRVIVQKYIDGRVGIFEFIYHRGRTLTWSYSHKFKTSPGPFGGSTVREFVHRPQLFEHIRRFGEATGFHGFSGFDFVSQHGTGAIYYIELHARPTAILKAGPPIGINIHQSLQCLLTDSSQIDFPAGEPLYPPPLFPESNGPLVPLFPDEIIRIIRENSWSSIPGVLLHPRFWRTMPWDDPPLWRSNLGQIKLAWHEKKAQSKQSC